MSGEETPVTVTGEVTLPAERPKVWAMLNDAAVLKVDIAGCQSLEKTSDATFAAVVKVKIGPVGASFKGKAQLSEINSPSSYAISGEGEGGIAGFANGGAKALLLGALPGAVLKYDVQANAGGKIAQLGSRLNRWRGQEDGGSVLCEFRDARGRAEFRRRRGGRGRAEFLRRRSGLTCAERLDNLNLFPSMRVDRAVAARSKADPAKIKISPSGRSLQDAREVGR